MKRKIITLILAIFFFGVAVPIIINELYKTGEGYITVWSGADVLSYYGSILGACGGVLGVFLSIRYAQKEYKEDARQRIMPFIATDFMLDTSCYNDFVEKIKLSNVTDKNGYDHFVITYSKEKGVQYPIYLSDKKADLLRHRGNYEIEDRETGAIVTTSKIVRFIPCVLKNVGSAVALKTSFGLYKLKDGNYEQEIEQRPSSQPMVIDKGEKIYVGLFFDLDDEEALGTYKFDIMYSDTNYTRYKRSITIEFLRNPETQRIEYKRIDTAEHEIYSIKKNGEVKIL